MKIKAIEKGWGEGSTYFSIGNECDEIKCNEVFVGKGLHNNLTIMIYQIIKNNKIIAEIEANSNLTIFYET